MNDLHRCPQCRTPLAADAPLGLCPECLLKQGFESLPGASEADPTAPGSGSGFVPPSPAELAPHFPELQIETLLGHGGMGAVYRARQKTLDRPVALKILPPRISADPAFAERFQREARTLARLNHPNIVVIHHFGHADSYYYLLMEYVDGVNLRQAIQAKSISPQQALGVVPQICDALQYAHEERVVHRDIKPENILLDKRGRVKIADFGLAKLLGRTPVELTLTATHQIMGTLHYMAPEQFERPLSVDHRADIYSLGVVFYELLTGDLPLGRYPLPSETAKVDVRLDNVVLKTLERKPEARYQHASEVKTDVESIAWDERPQRGAPRRGPVRPAATLSPSEQRLRHAAIAMMVVGALHVLLPLVVHLFLFFAVLFDTAQPRDLDDLLFLFLSIPSGVVMTLGGWSMYRRAIYGMAIAGVVAAMLPCGPIWFASLPVGILALLALRQEGIRASFADQWKLLGDYGPLKDSVVAWITQDRIRMPAVGLIVLGAFNLLIPATVFIAAVANNLNDDFFPLFLSVPSGALMVAGGIAMLRMRWYGLAMAGAIAAMIPCGPVWVVSLPVGIWAMLVLRREDVMASFALHRSERRRPEPPPVNVVAIQQQLRGPGWALVLTAAAGLISLAIASAAYIALAPIPLRGEEAFMIFVAIPVILSLPFTGLMVLGGWKMRKLEVYGVSLAAAIVAVLPIHPTVLLTFPVGVWSLALLVRRDVRAAYARAASPETYVEMEVAPLPCKPGQPDEQTRGKLTLPALGLLLAGIVNGLVALFLAGVVATGSRLDLPEETVFAFLISGLLLGAVFIVGGSRMLRFRSYYLALAAAILAIIPTSPAWPISIAFGIGALVQLMSRPVRREFQIEQQRVAA